MSSLNAIAQLIIVISALIILHEIGHYLGARLFKIDVEEFGIGFPPRLARLWREKGSIQIGGTNIIVPFGIKVRRDLDPGMWVDAIAQERDDKSYKLRQLEVLDPDTEDLNTKRESTQDGTHFRGQVTSVDLGTLYSLNWLPLGGFVKIRGEGDPTIPGGLADSSPWKRVAVYAAGPIMNLLLAIILYAVIISQLGMPDIDQVLITYIAPNSPADQAGLRSGDLVLSVDGKTIDSTTKLRDAIYAKLGQPIDLTYQRDGETLESTLTPRENPPEGEGAIGIVMGNPTYPISWFQALPYGVVSTYNHSLALLTLPAEVFRGAIAAEDARPVGYKGMYDIYQDVQERELVPGAPQSLNTIWFFTTITISLGILNLLPIPALDGGRILFALPEIILRRRIPASVQNAINMVSFTIMILLFFYINYLDFVNPVQLP